MGAGWGRGGWVGGGGGGVGEERRKRADRKSCEWDKSKNSEN